MANGLDGDRLRDQWEEIDRLNETLRRAFRVLKGVEVDILEAGGLDLPDDVLAEADWVVASVHYGQNQPGDKITRRIVGALENPHVSAIAHPTGRLIGRGKPYEVDLEAVFAAAKRQRQDAGIERKSGAARSGRCALRGREAARHSDRHLDRRPQHHRLGHAAVRHPASPPRRTDESGRGQHAAVGKAEKDDGEGCRALTTARTIRIEADGIHVYRTDRNNGNRGRIAG